MEGNHTIVGKGTNGCNLEKNRIIYLDIARTFAIIFVVLCHSVELIYKMNLQGWISISLNARIFKTIVFTLGRIGVPLFLFLTGYLLLNRKYDNDADIKKFYKKNLLPLIVTTEVWILIYNIFLSLYNNKPFDTYSLIKEMLFLQKVPLMNMWYMPMIIGIYIAIPYVSKVVHTFSIKTLKIPIILVFVCIFIMPTLNLILKTFKLDQYNCILDMNFLGGCYGLYIVGGYLIREKIIKKIKTKLLVFTSILFFIISCCIQIFEFEHKIEYNIWCNSPFIFICTFSLFELFTRINTDNFNKWIVKIFTYISKISLSIFFMHIIVEMIFSKYIKMIKISNPAKVLILFIVSLCISIIVTWLLSKIRLMRKRVLCIKD